MSIFHFIGELDFVNAAVLAPVEDDLIVDVEFLAASGVRLFVNDAAHLHAVVFLLHLNTVRKPPEFFMADEVVADLRAGESWKSVFVVFLYHLPTLSINLTFGSSLNVTRYSVSR